MFQRLHLKIEVTIIYRVYLPAAAAATTSSCCMEKNAHKEQLDFVPPKKFER